MMKSVDCDEVKA